ncbi:MAG TPA: TOPRIM nucleotidyl transferase/hydrolase domain-containing protein [Gaiellaceae bacterium]|nr:TOPRIM nucleotidyl transferase/hydrolase domain-containing protein [Gaiellaceae bacterium]
MDPDREAISVVDCGGKSNIPLLGRICRAVGVPFVAVHDRDAMAGREPIAAERALNELIAEVASPVATFVLEPDFEGASGLQGHNAERAWRHLSSLPLADMPAPLLRAAQLAIALAGGERERP